MIKTVPFVSLNIYTQIIITEQWAVVFFVKTNSKTKLSLVVKTLKDNHY